MNIWGRKLKILEIMTMKTEVTEEMRREAVTDEYGVMYSRDGEWLISALGCTVLEYWMKEGTKYVADAAFYNSLITVLHQPESLVAIGMDVYGFSYIEELNLPKNLRYIPKVNPFAHCQSVKRGRASRNGSWWNRGCCIAMTERHCMEP